MFSPRQDGGRHFLQLIESNINISEFSALSKEGGFSAPNEFSIENMLVPLEARDFPGSEHYEYAWAIYECGVDRINNYSPFMRLYVAALYIFCDKKCQWGTRIESDYYLVAMNAAREVNCVDELVFFLEWLYECVNGDHGYDDYFCVLSWLILNKEIKAVAKNFIDDVVKYMLKKRYDSERLLELSVSEDWRLDWLRMNEITGSKNTCLYDDINRIITGKH